MTRALKSEMHNVRCDDYFQHGTKLNTKSFTDLEQITVLYGLGCSDLFSYLAKLEKANSLSASLLKISQQVTFYTPDVSCFCVNM